MGEGRETRKVIREINRYRLPNVKEREKVRERKKREYEREIERKRQNSREKRNRDKTRKKKERKRQKREREKIKNRKKNGLATQMHKLPARVKSRPRSECLFLPVFSPVASWQ